MELYSKFNDKNGDCKAYYLDIDGSYQRIGANEFNNVEHSLTEEQVMNERIKIGVPFSSLKTEIETMQNVHLPE